MNSMGDAYIIRYFRKTYYFYMALLFADFSLPPYLWVTKENEWHPAATVLLGGALRLLLFFSLSLKHKPLKYERPRNLKHKEM